jgi:peptide deformylase
MIRPIVKDVFFLGQKSAEATKEDLPVGQDLQDTLTRKTQNSAERKTL